MIGIKALQAGLVHCLGGIDDAIAVAKQLAEISASTDIDLMILESGKSMTIPMVGAKLFAGKGSVSDLTSWMDYLAELGETKLWAIDPVLFESSVLAPSQGME